MIFVKRLGFYILGFAVGLIFLAYFFRGKNTSFCYSPNCRVIKNITTKKIEFSKESTRFLMDNHIDSSVVYTFLKQGDVLFSKSSPRETPCAVYIIKGILYKTAVEATVENCIHTATIKTIESVRP